MISIELLKKRHGKRVSKKVLNYIKCNLRISDHSIEKMEARSNNLVSRYKTGRVNYIRTINNICNAIDRNILAYYNTDGSINIAITRWKYFVFEFDAATNKWLLVTFKEASLNGVDIYAKRQLAIDGYDRK